MRRLVLIAVGLALFALVSFTSARAQGPILPGPGLPVAAAASYQGPGDVFNTSPKGWYSCARAYNAAYATALGSLCDIVDTATGAASCTIVAKASGFADLTSLSCAGGTVSVTTFCTVTHPAGCSVTKMYNHISPGTCDEVQATLASMPLLLLSSTPTGTLPAVQASGAVGTMQVSTCAAVGQPVAFSGVMIRTSGTTIAGLIGQSGGANMGFDTAGNAYVNATTNIDLAAANGAWHSINSLANGNGTASAINVDGTDQTGAAGALGIAANTLRVARVFSLTGTVAFAEIGQWNAATASTDRNNVCKNQASASGYNTAFGC